MWTGANLALTMSATLRIKKDYMGAVKARIDPSKCIECGLCQKNCSFGAISNNRVNPVNNEVLDLLQDKGTRTDG